MDQRGEESLLTLSLVETDKKPYEAIMNLNHSDALSVSTNNQGNVHTR